MTEPWLEESAAAASTPETGAGLATEDPAATGAHPVTPELGAEPGADVTTQGLDGAASQADRVDGAAVDAASGAASGTGTEPTPVRAPDAASTPADDAPLPAAHYALLEAVRRLEAHVSAETSRVLCVFSDKLAYDAAKEEQVSRLHAELQQHRDGMLERATRPLLNAVIRVHDNLGKVAASLRARPAGELTPERTFRVLDGFREDLELLLGQHGVEPFEPLDDVFDPRLHTALRTVPTGDPARAGRIAQRLRPGFSHGATLLQKARVAVFTAQGAAPAGHPAPSPASTDIPANGGEG